MEAIDVDLRGIAILYLADRFKKLYIKWRCAWIQYLANHKSELLSKNSYQIMIIFPTMWQSI